MSRYLVSGQGYRYRITIDISTQFSQEQLSQLSESKCIKIEDMTLTAQTDTNTKIVSKRDQTEEKQSISDEQPSKGLIRRLFFKEEEELPTVEEIYRLSQINHQRVYDRWVGRTGQHLLSTYIIRSYVQGSSRCRANILPKMKRSDWMLCQERQRCQ